MEDFEDEEMIGEMFDKFVEMGLIEIVGLANDGTPLFKFSEEFLEDPEMMEIHQAITNDILSKIWIKGYIEMYPLNEDGDWKIELCEKSFDFEGAKKDLEEDEFILFTQIYDELSQPL